MSESLVINSNFFRPRVCLSHNVMDGQKTKTKTAS